MVLCVLCLLLCLGFGDAFVSLPMRRKHLHRPTASSSTTLRSATTDGSDDVYEAPWFGETRLERLPALSYTLVYIGTPPKIFRLQVDTGSADLVIPGAQCVTCADDNIFFFNESRSGHVPPLCHGHGCAFAVQYGDGTKVKGLLIRDRMAFDFDGRPALSSMVFMDLMLAAYPIGVFSAMGINGILGLGFDSITSNHMPAPLTSIIQQQDLEDMFAMYVGAEVGGDDGVLTIGGIDRSRFEGRLQYTPILQRSYYCVGPTALRIGSQHVVRDPQDFGMAFVDSGTTFTLLPEQTFHAIRTMMQRDYCHLPLVCPSKDKPGITMFNNYCLVGKELPKGFPVFHWYFRDDVVVDVPPEAYFRKIPYEENTRFMFCFGIGPIKTDPPYTILGDTFMTAAYVVFDRQQMRIGFGTPTHSPVAGHSLPPKAPPQWPTFTLVASIILTVVACAICWLGQVQAPGEPNRLHSPGAAPQSQYGAA
eukprot:GGOE01061921.1.p1 GENE.GGOE01061921.1~~GGOE01061921.1.p1  ORF type:complete len:477 (-),score=117.25 GGOE01061921.1:186-1616(-)